MHHTDDATLQGFGEQTARGVEAEASDGCS